MLTEKGFDEALSLCNIPKGEKDLLSIKSYEVQKIAKKLVESRKPENYDPIDRNKGITKTTKESALRGRGFRQAVIEAYDCKCAVCGLKIQSPDSLLWEVEAAHIVPNRALGRDDVWNGIAMCQLHHWAFDVGWFALLDNYWIQGSTQIQHLPDDFGKIASYEFIRSLVDHPSAIFLPKRTEIQPDRTAIRWHRENIFGRRTAIHKGAFA
jgi:putative restriction endonuclease